MKPVALLITYTMLNPIVGGAFFRGLRLARELYRRGWRPIILNSGPTLRDPKIDEAQGEVQFASLCPASRCTIARAREWFESLDPSVIIMGEGPFQTMRVFYDGARQTDCPFVVLDQYYSPFLLPDSDGVDLVLLYGLRSFWPELRLAPPFKLSPPFIETITSREELPIPPALDAIPWVTLISYDDAVLQQGIALCDRAKPGAGLVIVAHDPRRAADYVQRTTLDRRRTVVLPFQSDADLFGIVHASRVALVSNGFLQIMDSLALGCPVIALARAGGVGMSELNIAERFDPYVSLQEDRETQCERLRGWLAESPFPPSLQEALAGERGGITFCADHIEALVRR